MQLKIFIAAMALLFILPSCKTKQPTTTQVSYARPSVIIYKTKADYSKNVPVTLSDDKSEIVSYPDMQDVYFNGKLAYPTQLAKGFWLDNRGINTKSAFLKLTYEEYAQLKALPDIKELYKTIIDKDPFIEIYNIGNRTRFKDEVKEINTLIEQNQLKEFKKLK